MNVICTETRSEKWQCFRRKCWLLILRTYLNTFICINMQSKPLRFPHPLATNPTIFVLDWYFDWYYLKKVRYGAGVWVSECYVIRIPVYVADISGESSVTDNVVIFICDLLNSQVRIVDANQDLSTFSTTVNQDFVKQLRHWDLGSCSILI